MSISTKKIGFFVIALIVAIIWLLSPDKEVEKKKAYFRTLNLKMTGIVKQVIPTNEHGYGVVYLKNVKSNKGSYYESLYMNSYLFCKISNDESIILLPGTEEINAKDSIVLNSNNLVFEIYQKGKLYTELGIWLNNDDRFYDPLKINGYLNFSYYHKK